MAHTCGSIQDTCFSHTLDHVGEQSKAPVPDILNNFDICRKLKIELEATVLAVHPFVRTKYTLEGDGPLATTACEYEHSFYVHITGI